MKNEFSPHRLQLLKGIARGEQAIREGRTLSQTQARKRFTQKSRRLSKLFANAPLAQIIPPRSKDPIQSRSAFE